MLQVRWNKEDSKLLTSVHVVVQRLLARQVAGDPGAAGEQQENLHHTKAAAVSAEMLRYLDVPPQTAPDILSI